MAKKLTYEEVKEVFESKGNKLISTDYANADTPLDYICDCGKLDKKTLYNFRKGQRCKACGIEKNHKNQRLSFEEVKRIFEEQGNKLMSTQYVNYDTPLEYICDCGMSDKKRIRDFKKGSRCKECKKRKISEKKRLSFEEVKTTFESQGNTLISKQYINSNTPLEYICDCGEPDKKSLSNFKNGQRCKKCADIKTGNGLRMHIDEVKKLFEEKGCQLTGDYVNSQTPVDFICKCGEKGRVRIGKFRNGVRCDKCNNKKRVETKQKNNDYARKYQELFEKKGYKMLETYVGAIKEILVRCPKKHEYPVRPANFKTGHRCPDCADNKKKTLDEIKNIFENDGYFIHSKEYHDAFSKLEVTCSKGHDTEISWDNFRAGKRCRVCNESKGEKKVFGYLIKHEVFFDTQYTFDDCRHKRKLPFDFVIFDEFGEVAQLIEYDGQLHEILNPYIKDPNEQKKALKNVQKRDKIKTDYCRKNGIPLLRIKYTEFNRIEEILEKELVHFIKTMV